MSQETRPNVLWKGREDIQVLDLRDLLSRKEEDLNKTRATLDGIREERDQLRRKVHKLLLETNRSKETRRSCDNLISREISADNLPVTKKAERVKVKKTRRNVPNDSTNSRDKIHGTDLDPEILSSGVTEQIVQDIATSADLQEIFSHSCQVLDRQSCDFQRELNKNLQLEMERINCCFEKARTENGLLRLTLQESKSKTEQLQMLLSKFESNDTAYSMTLFYSEIIAETLSALVCALEREILKREFFEDLLRHMKKPCRMRLQRARHGLHSLMHEGTIATGVSHNIDEFFDRCLERSDDPLSDLTPSHLAAIIGLCRELAERKNAVKRSIINLGSFSVEALQAPLKLERSVSEYDLENAVLLHELASVKEELINLKCEYEKSNHNESVSARNNLLTAGKEDSSSSLSSSSCGFAFNGSVQSLRLETESELDRKPAFLSLADLRIGTMTESELGTELSEALKREQRLKKENDRLAFTLQQVQQNSEKRHVKSTEMMSTLKTSYSTLLENSKKDRQKHVARVRELEALLAFFQEQHSVQVEELQRRILVYERERENLVLPDNETAL